MHQVRWIRLACATLFTAGFIYPPSTLGASAVDELIRRMPDSVLGFAATGGSDAFEGDFEKTPLGRIWNDQGVRTFYQSVKTELMAKARSEDPNVPQKVDLVLNYVRLALSRPILIGVAEVPVPEGPPMAAFAILEGGNRRAELAAAVSKLEAVFGPDKIIDIEVGSLKMRSVKENDDLPLYWGWAGSSFVIAVNDGQGAVVKYLSKPRSTTPGHLKRVPGASDALVAFADTRRIREAIGSFIRDEEGEAASSTFTAVLKKLGLNDTGTFSARADFVQSEIVVHAVLEMPAPATGILAISKPIDPAWFRMVDARAVTAGAANWDVAGLYDTVLDAIKTGDPDDAYRGARKAIVDLESQIGLRIREDLLASLAGPMVFYSLPMGTTLDVPQGGRAVVVKLKDVPRFEKAMTALGRFINGKIEGMVQVSSLKRDDGRTVHVWTMAPMAMMRMMPTWSVAGDHVVMASNMELCDVAVKQLTSKEGDGKSLLDVENFKKTTAGLPASLASLSYVDSQVNFSQLVMQAQQAWPMIAMAAMQGDVKLPPMLPSVAEIAKNLKPSLRYSYYGPDGLHSMYQGPGIESGRVSVPNVALGMGVLMPALARVRQLAFRMTSGTNLSGIGKACLIYANDHDDKLPPDLQTLVKEVEVSPKSLESKLKPEGFEGPSFVYVPGQDVSMHPSNVVAYENPEFCTEGVNVLFLDTHVEFMKPQEFRQELKETYERLKRPLPKIRFANEEPDGGQTQSVR